jgi:hypothetical protein
MAGNREVDHVTGVETTGHEWDGIKELNKPLPKWWLYILYATIVWSIGYWILYPAWPLLTSYTEGVLGYSQRQQVADSIAAAREAQAGGQRCDRRNPARRHQGRSQTPRRGHCRRARRFRRQLRAMPRARRAGLHRLSQSQ